MADEFRLPPEAQPASVPDSHRPDGRPLCVLGNWARRHGSVTCRRHTLHGGGAKALSPAGAHAPAVSASAEARAAAGLRTREGDRLRARGVRRGCSVGEYVAGSPQELLPGALDVAGLEMPADSPGACGEHAAGVVTGPSNRNLISRRGRREGADFGTVPSESAATRSPHRAILAHPYMARNSVGQRVAFETPVRLAPRYEMASVTTLRGRRHGNARPNHRDEPPRCPRLRAITPDRSQVAR